MANKTASRAMITTIFIHHKNDEVTRHHWRLAQDHSESAIAVSATHERMEGQQSIYDYPEAARRLATHVDKNPSLRARSTDLILIEWFKAAKPEGDSFFIAEWDTLISMPVAEFVKPVATCPLSAATTRFPNREPEWSWFKELRSLPAEIQSHACGVMPFLCIHVSRHALSTIANAYPSPGTANSELRFGTVANASGFRPVHNPNAGPEITWKPLSMFGAGRTIYHPVKHMVTNKPWMTEPEIKALELLLFPGAHVLEYGAGGSTFWLASRVHAVTSIEHDPAWSNKMMPLPPNVEVRTVPPKWPLKERFAPAEEGQFDDYVGAADDIQPDIVLVDGRDRVACANRWKDTALVVLHDANRERYRSLPLKHLCGSLCTVEH